MRVQRQLRVVRCDVRVEPPVDDRERVVHGTGDDDPLTSPLVLGADVDEYGAVPRRRVGFGGRDPAQVAARLGEELVDRAALGQRC